ncbi:MAG: dihydroxy-acid dehydratase, partial [Pseudomonadota bacterium]
KVPAAIHVTPEALHGGPLAKLRDGDRVRVDAVAGTLEALVDAAEWAARTPATIDAAQADDHAHGLGRELFAGMRRLVTSAEQGACTWLPA